MNKTIPTMREESPVLTQAKYNSLSDDTPVLVKEKYLTYLKLVALHRFSDEAQEILKIALHQELEPYDFLSKVMRKQHLGTLISHDNREDKTEIFTFISKIDDSYKHIYVRELKKLDEAWKKHKVTVD